MPDEFYKLCDKLAKWNAQNGISLKNVKGGPWPEKSNTPVTIKSDTWYLFGLQTEKSKVQNSVKVSASAGKGGI